VPQQPEDLKMSFVEMTNEEWEAVYKQHDALIRMAELEMRAEIREAASESNQASQLQPVEAAAHQL
jgi:hypothetical protein